jgi:hypothetical protein
MAIVDGALEHVEWRVGDSTESGHLIDLKRIRLEASQLFRACTPSRPTSSNNDRGAAELAFVNMTGFRRGILIGGTSILVGLI